MWDTGDTQTVTLKSHSWQYGEGLNIQLYIYTNSATIWLHDFILAFKPEPRPSMIGQNERQWTRENKKGRFWRTEREGIFIEVLGGKFGKTGLRRGI